MPLLPSAPRRFPPFPILRPLRRLRHLQLPLRRHHRRSFCDAGASASPPQKFPQKEEKTLRPSPFSPRPPVASPLFQSPVLSDAFATFDSLSAAIAEAGASLDLAILLRFFCDAGTSALTPLPLPSPSQKSPQKEEETFCPGRFSPCPPPRHFPPLPIPRPLQHLRHLRLPLRCHRRGRRLPRPRHPPSLLLRWQCLCPNSFASAFPPQKSPQNEEETLLPCPFSPRLPPSSNPPSSPTPLLPLTPSPPSSPRPAPPSISPPSSAPSATPAPPPSPSPKISSKRRRNPSSRSLLSSPPPIFQSPVLFDAFATFDSLSAAIAKAGASLDLATLGCIAEEFGTCMVQVGLRH